MKDLNRRDAIKVIALGASGCRQGVKSESNGEAKTKMQNESLSVIDRVIPLAAGPWPTFDPFLFCVHHDDQYPVGNKNFGPDASLSGRDLGMDFSRKDGWSMYHGETVPGFPRHPHRGFETVTVVDSGLVDHADSLGAAARYGRGDIQWMTAGAGINHAEMFPLLHSDQANPVDFFQIWINLSQANKLVKPYFSMFWAQDVPIITNRDANGAQTKVKVIAGQFESAKALKPPPDSWAATESNEVAILSIKMTPEASIELPAVGDTTNRTLYFFSGDSIKIGNEKLMVNHLVTMSGSGVLSIHNGGMASQLLLLQGKGIEEPVARHGPFVMNTREEIHQAFNDYRRTEFGGWPWDKLDPVHGEKDERFARHADGRIEKPT